MEQITTINEDISQIKGILAQVLTISYYSVLRDENISKLFIDAVNNEKDIYKKCNSIISLIKEVNLLVRSEGFLSINKMSNKIDNRLYVNIINMISDTTNLYKITSMYKPLFYYFNKFELVENVLIHDGLLMCVLGYTSNEIEFTLNNMIGNHINIK